MFTWLRRKLGPDPGAVPRLIKADHVRSLYAKDDYGFTSIKSVGNADSDDNGNSRRWSFSQEHIYEEIDESLITDIRKSCPSEQQGEDKIDVAGLDKEHSPSLLRRRCRSFPYLLDPGSTPSNSDAFTEHKFNSVSVNTSAQYIRMLKGNSKAKTGNELPKHFRNEPTINSGSVGTNVKAPKGQKNKSSNSSPPNIKQTEKNGQHDYTRHGSDSGYEYSGSSSNGSDVIDISAGESSYEYHLSKAERLQKLETEVQNIVKVYEPLPTKRENLCFGNRKPQPKPRKSKLANALRKDSNLSRSNDAIERAAHETIDIESANDHDDLCRSDMALARLRRESSAMYNKSRLSKTIGLKPTIDDILNLREPEPKKTESESDDSDENMPKFPGYRKHRKSDLHMNAELKRILELSTVKCEHFENSVLKTMQDDLKAALRLSIGEDDDQTWCNGAGCVDCETLSDTDENVDAKLDEELQRIISGSTLAGEQLDDTVFRTMRDDLKTVLIEYADQYSLENHYDIDDFDPVTSDYLDEPVMKQLTANKINKQRNHKNQHQHHLQQQLNNNCDYLTSFPSKVSNNIPHTPQTYASLKRCKSDAVQNQTLNRSRSIPSLRDESEFESQIRSPNNKAKVRFKDTPEILEIRDGSLPRDVQDSTRDRLSCRTMHLGTQSVGRSRGASILNGTHQVQANKHHRPGLLVGTAGCKTQAQNSQNRLLSDMIRNNNDRLFFL